MPRGQAERQRLGAGAHTVGPCPPPAAGKGPTDFQGQCRALCPALGSSPLPAPVSERSAARRLPQLPQPLSTGLQTAPAAAGRGKRPRELTGWDFSKPSWRDGAPGAGALRPSTRGVSGMLRAGAGRPLGANWGCAAPRSPGRPRGPPLPAHTESPVLLHPTLTACLYTGAFLRSSVETNAAAGGEGGHRPRLGEARGRKRGLWPPALAPLVPAAGTATCRKS